jgi:hypothetical protein
MHHKLIRLHQQLGVTAGNSPTPEAIELATEILGVFGLPPTDEYKSILMDFCKSEPLTDELIDATLLTIADEGAYYQTISKLEQ